MKRAGETSGLNTNVLVNNATTESSSTSEAPQDEDDTSGGWIGPHACAGDYCVYAHPTFAAGRGIALITTPESAQALANLPVFSELASPSASEAFLKSANINMRNPATEVRYVPGKGRGLAAAQPIHRGTQVMAYTPALLLHRNLVDDLGRADQLRLLRDAVGRLPASSTRVAFWRQLGQTHADGDDDILDIVMNNSFNLPLLPGTGLGPFIGNFPEVSMYNHDCRPNVAFHLDHGIIHRTTAVAGGNSGGVGVPAGQELSISYVDGFRVRDVRRARTLRNWGFECACAQCSLPEALANASDHRLFRLYEVENSLLLSAGDAPNAAASGQKKQKRGGGDKEAQAAYETRTLDSVSLLLSLYEQERLLEAHGSSAYRVAALNYNSFRRAEGAVKYALLALEQFVVEEGANSVSVREMVALLDDPEAHWSWGLRAKGK
ncbi:SET domain-containing protein 5 [Diaporthe australafricana]|uniref:SET domain-containing protein 5 n=1 Tax=Diaporthe australafricana TaxID=127596 RepID=A0ABR3W6X2_9PEZI